ncbi:hypothetical protein MBLNU459_g1119t1 [Dothideomycetes sp. NU459]
MAKRRVKKRTHVGAKGTAPAAGAGPTKPGERTPKSMVIRIGAGEVGPSVSQLVKDVRSMMEPGTASRLKERRTNRLRDYTTMAGPLGITHLMLFSRSESGNTNMRLAITPRGPTLHFRVDKYSLCKDVMKSMKRPKSGGAEYLTSPLLVMNNFNTPTPDPSASTPADASNPIPKHLESLTTTIFQSLFAPISPQQTSLKSIRRVMLLDRKPASPSDPHQYVLQLRHYAITTQTPKNSLPKALRRLETAETVRHSNAKHALPNLGKLDDVADYLLDSGAAAGFTSASESDADTDAEVEVLAPAARKVLTKEERQRMRDAQRTRLAAAAANANGAEPLPERAPRRAPTEKKAIKLQELGPRMTLRLTKVEEGLCGGKIMWHEYISKTASEEKAQDKKWAERNKEKEERRRVQKENVERKRKERKAAGGGKKGEGEAGGEDDDDEDEDMADWSDGDDVWDEVEDEEGEEDDDDEDDEK